MHYSKLILFFCMTSLFLLSSPVMAQDSEEEEQETSAPATSGDLSVIEAKSAAGVEEREAVNESDSFSVDDNVTIWAAFRNPEAETTAEIVWTVGDTEIHTYSMTIGKSYRWRTWAQLKVSRAGDWNVALKDSDGNTLETLSFTVSDS